MIINTSSPRTFSRIWTSTSPSANRPTRAFPKGILSFAHTSRARVSPAPPAKILIPLGILVFPPKGIGTRAETSEMSLREEKPCVKTSL